PRSDIEPGRGAGSSCRGRLWAVGGQYGSGTRPSVQCRSAAVGQRRLRGGRNDPVIRRNTAGQWPVTGPGAGGTGGTAGGTAPCVRLGPTGRPAGRVAFGAVCGAESSDSARLGATHHR